MSEVRHQYRRPAWTCLACNEPWPCASRRARFMADYALRKPQLRSLLGTLLLTATQDLNDPVEVLHERFVAWSYRPVNR